MSCVVVQESQPCENSSDYDNVGTNGGDRIMERNERADRRWQLQNMHPTFSNVRAPGSWMHQTSKQ